MSRGRRLALLGTWIALIAVLSVAIGEKLRVGADLRLFMPAPRTPAQRLLLEEIGEGPGARLTLVALEGASPETLAASSQALAAALAADPLFRFASNGDVSLESIPESLLAYRYLLTSTFDEHPLDRDTLKRELESRAQDLASPAASLLEAWLPRDPTLEVLNLAQSWRPALEPERLYDVWFDAKHERALLVAESVAPGFDPDGQRVALDALQRHFEQTRTDPAVRLVASGPGTFAVMMKERASGEATWIGTVDTVAMIVLMLVAYRSFGRLVLGMLPLLSAGVAGLAAVAWFFGAVHGITLAFGFTLIGVAQDYPVHLLSHQRPSLSPIASARALWPTLATGVASTCIAYLAFLFSGVNGLGQLACFTIVGLAVASLTTRFLLPHLIGASRRDPGRSEFLGRLWAAIERLPVPRAAGVLLAAACIGAIAFAPGPLWENNLAALTPVPKPLLDQDLALRRALGAPDVRYLLVLESRDADAALAAEETLARDLDALVAAKAIDGYDLAARYLPSRATQLRRQAALPDAATLRADLDAALADSPFKRDVFEPFLRDVADAKSKPPLDVAGIAGTPLELRVGALLHARDDHWTALATFSGVHDVAAIAELARTHPQVALMDLKGASETLVAGLRERILISLAIAAVLLVLTVWLALRDAARVRRVLAPMALTTLIIVAIVHVSGVPMSLFHLIALVLAAGLGLDYALFFEHAEDDPEEQRRTLHAVIVCSLSTLIVFALLAFSSLPVLRAIGTTVAIGVVSNFVLALALTRPPKYVAR